MIRQRLVRTIGITSVVGGLLALPAVLEGVLVAPHAVFIDHASRTGQLTLVNTGTDPEEVTIDLRFGYPDTDSAGNIFVRLIDQPGDDQPSAASWIRAFPRQVRLLPGARQVVRLLATPPAGIADGEYWSRVLVTSRGAAVPVAGGDSLVSAGVTLELRTIISVTYRKGGVQTGVQLGDLSVQVHNDSLIAWVDLAREGNAAYLGQVTFDLRDANNRSVASWPTPIAVYYTLRRRFAFPLSGVEAGTYTLHFTLNTDREDLDPQDVLPAEAITRSMGIEVPTR